ncbi:heavy metal sensor histidine kinase [Pseudoduganella chitinolytica]|uniref:Sensor protein n=1 Tax=Pseudoduganella chitinolytica TaxID=34070 RepID=A0ABY8B7C9_9BURK|nr:heavy metal sensor histidine kinase [Pseudoduganella chitinolytica]WEF31705.1 heavy metal sensor histidine kinase [Pseudoduganella chitinolytica]
MRRLASLSIALRLALLFSAIAAAVFLAVGAYLYQALSQQMSERDDTALLDKVVLIRHLLASQPMPLAMPDELRMVLDNVFGQDGMALRLTDAAGRTVVVTSTREDAVPAWPAVPLARAPARADIRDWQLAAGPGRAIVALASAGTAQVPVRITIVRQRSHRLAILRRYTSDLAAGLAVGTLVATGLAFAVVRRGMRPLHDVIGKANEISTQRLASRLSVEDVPAELRELGVAFNAMLDRLEEGVQRLSGFAADLAHDLRTPLNTLMMQTQVALSRPRGSADYEALLASNLEEYERLARMIENTLFLARADHAQLALHRVALDAAQELAHIAEYFDMLAEEGGIALRVDAAGAVHADPILLRRAVNNLVANAVRHTPRGGSVVLWARQEAGGSRIEVRNTGGAIAPQHLAQLFDRYYRADPARGDASGAAGLGLAIVRAIMQLHGGAATAASANGSTVFTLRFPPPPAAPTQNPAPAGGASGND